MTSDYDRKFEEMKQYIPFLENMIKRLEKSSSSANPRQAQLDKIMSLRNLLLDKKKRMKMENLLKCEQVLLNLYTKVDQKETLPGIKKASDSANDSNDKSDLSVVRRKLISVVSIEERKEVEDTLPEIARANETEVFCSPGSKEPALFQRRPQIASISPSPKEPIKTENKLPQKPVQKRNYTRVLVSPDSSDRRWSTGEEPSDKPLFSRRSPRRSPRRFSPSYNKKERKKSSTETKKPKNKDLNITLNVPEDSLNSLNTEDIFSRIINCSDGDVDIDTLRDLRKQILGELKHTGANEDISDLILKSYKKKKPKNKKKVEVEEGEISDSESEVIESVYGSLVLVDKDKGTSSEAKLSTEKEAQPRKIQICFVINSDKESLNTNENIAEDDKKLHSIPTDISELEMFDNNDKTKSVEVKEVSKQIEVSEKEIKEKAEIECKQQQASMSVKQGLTVGKSDTQIELDQTKIQDVITIDDEGDVQPESEKNEKIEQNSRLTRQKVSGNVSETEIILEKSEKTSDEPNNVSETETILHKFDKTSHEPINIVPFKANFYTPLNENETKETNDLKLNTKITEPHINTNKPHVETKNITNMQNKINTSSSNKNNVSTELIESPKKSIEIENSITRNIEDNIEIPLLNLDPIVPEPPAKEAVSEIDILQALKNEILSDNIPIPGTEGVTPALHQPKITKVASAREIIRKKRISIEKYKEKSVTSSKQSWFRDIDSDIYMSSEEQSKKQSLKLTEKERERFNFAAKIALNDSSDEDLNKEYSLDDIYGDLAPESPENDESNRPGSTPPVVIPVDPVKSTMINSKSDVDMRTLMPLLSPTAPKPIPAPGSIKLLSPTINDTLLEDGRQNKRDENYRPPLVDPRIKWELNKSVERDSPRDNHNVINPERTPRPSVNYQNMTPNMTPSRTPSLTPNARTFELTPTHMSFEFDDNLSKKHVYAPSFPNYERREHREMSLNKESQRPHWEPNDERTRESRRMRWENSESRDRNYSRKWEGCDPRSTSMQRDYPPNFQRFRNSDSLDKYQNDRYGSDRRDDYSYSRSDCPRTPIHSFGRSDCPATPTHSFGRMETPLTPVHPFGRSDCPPTPSHTFGRSECPTTPSHPFGRSECPTTPSHSFGRSDCPATPSHPFGRSDVNMPPMTPTHPFGRSDYPPSHSITTQKFIKDPRLNRSIDNKPSSLNYDDDRDRGYYKDRRTSDVLNRSYNTSDSYRNYSREQRVGRNDGPYDRSYNTEQTSRPEPSVGGSITKDYDSNKLYSGERSRQNKDHHFEAETTYNEVASRKNYQRASSVGRTLTSNDNRSTSQTPCTSRNYRGQENDNTLSVKAQSGRSFTIDTSVNRTFQEFLNNKGIQSLDYTFDANRQRASSVGRSLIRESSAGRTHRESSIGPTLPESSQPEPLHNNSEFRDNFVRARSMGREMVENKHARSLKDIKADFRLYSTNFKIQQAKTKPVNVKTFNYVDPRTRRENREKQQKQCNSVNTKQGYLPSNNNRNPRLRKEQKNYRNKYSAEKKSYDKRNYGIVYSNDNITKGTILGSGYGVKNYKIPKIKRVTEVKDDIEKDEEIENEKGSTGKIKVDQKEKVVKVKNTKNIKTNVIQKGKQNKDGKLNLVHEKQDDEYKSTLENATKKSLRSNAKVGNIESKFFEYGSTIKNRKPRKAVISDSDSDSQENEESNDSKILSCNQETTASIKHPISISDQVHETDKNEDDLSSFGIGYLDLFPDNLVSDPVMDNINALIANLDNDIGDSKDNTSKQFTKEISLVNMLESISSAPSPTGSLKKSTVEESLNDLNELINEDLNKSTPESQVESQGSHIKENLKSDDQNQIIQTVKENVHIKSNDSEVVATESANLNITDSKTVNRVINESTEAVKESIDISRNKSEKISDNPNLSQKEPTDNTLHSKKSISPQKNLNEEIYEINRPDEVRRDSTEAIVSTTETPKESINKLEKVGELTGECYPDRSSTPDSTNEIVKVKPCDEELPDSTNEMQNQMHSDISSSHDSSQISNKQTEHLLSKGTALQIDTIGNLLSMLQDKSKIKELLSMLGDQSAGSEKIKKKLERLSEIVSDDEEVNTVVDRAEVTSINKEVADSVTIQENKSKAHEIIEESNRVENALEIIEQSNHKEEACKIIEQIEHKEDRATVLIEKSKSEELSPKKNKLKGVPVALGESKYEEERALEMSEHKDKKAPETKESMGKVEESSEIIVEGKSIENNSNDHIKLISEAVERLDNTEIKKIYKDISQVFGKTEENALGNNGLESFENMNEDNSEDLNKTRENSNLNSDQNKSDTDDTNYESDSELSAITLPHTSRRGKKTLKRLKSGRFKRGVQVKGKRVTRSKTAILQPKPKRASRELKQLQDDIKEMFLSDDILNATGIRTCRIAKLVDEKSSNQEEESTIAAEKPLVILEKLKNKDKHNDVPASSKMKKKSVPKQTVKALKSDNFTGIANKGQKNEISKQKPGPKSKTISHQEPSEPSEIDYDSVSENKLSDGQVTSSDSENESLASSRSFGSSEILIELKKKPKRKRRGAAWQSGVIKPNKKKKKVESKPTDSSLDDNILVPQGTITIPDMNCFTDKTYCFLKNVSTYACRLCDYRGNEIVHHYKRRHPHTEIPLSRMNAVIAREAIEQCEEFNFQTISKISTNKYVCRFCFQEFNDKRKSNPLEVFFWHVVSTHTGEYKQLCSECINITSCPFNLDIPPPPKDVKGQLLGFICGKCNYTQISLENLKTHVIVRHNDEQTEVCSINLALMTRKTINALMKQSFIEERPRMLRSSRSNQSITEASDDRSDITESTDRLSELDSIKRRSIKDDSSSTEPRKLNIKSKTTLGDSSIKMERKNYQITDVPHFYDEKWSPTVKLDSSNPETSICKNEAKTVRRTASDDIVDYPHFKISYTVAGAKEYVCCINRNDNHYKTALLISMKKHIQTKHTENWDGYCFICKVIVTTQGLHNFKECLQHLLDKHIDNFPVLERIVESEEKPEDVPVDKTPDTEVLTVEKPLTLKPCINVRPLAELLSNEEENLPGEKSLVTLPIIKSVASLDPGTVEPSLPSPIYPKMETASPQDISAHASKYTQIRRKAPSPDEPFKYEEAQVEVMKQKHQVVLDSMMSHDKLIKIFKCAGRYCYFTSDSLEAALLHASTHQRIGGENALLCSYCDFDSSGNAIALVMHVFKIHGRCPFVCAFCFYRGAASQLVQAHMIRVHSQQYNEDAVLKTDTVTPVTDDPGDMLQREDVVQYYNCADAESNCKFKTYTHKKFVDHLSRHKPPYVCFICSAGLPTPSDLVHHMKSHNMNMYQCTWCHHGADNESALLDHASSCHPCRQPQAYVRIITTKDGSSKMMVLPMGQYNKSAVPTELVPSNNSNENPVREAERSIELEKLIGSMSETFAVSPIPRENESEVVPDLQESLMLIEMKSVKEPRLVTPPSTLAREENVSLPIKPVLKTEPPDDTPEKNILSADIICLDSDEDSKDSRPNIIDLSDEEASAPNIEFPRLKDLLETTKELPASLKDLLSMPKDVVPTIKDEVATPKDKVPTPKNALSIPEDTLSTPKDVLPTPNDALSTTKDSSTSDPKFLKIPADSLYKCPKCGCICKSLHGFKRHSHCFLNDNDTVVCSHCPLILNSKTEFYKHIENDHKSTDSQNKDSAKDSQNASCGVCNLRHRSLSFVKSHLKAAHGITNLVVASKYGDNGELVYTVRESPKPKPTPKRKLSAGNAESPAKKKRYGPQDVDLLPKKPILDELAYCSLCEFSSKVRLNLVRHLQGHADKQPVAQTVPVNPVPHLESNEKHFDKMVNLASSSVVTRGPDKQSRVDNTPTVSLVIPPEATSRFPKYVVERQRLSCGAKGCSYISVDEAMLKCHWETLHAGSNEFHCVHCPPYQHLDTTRPLTASRIIGHLKMHDTRLYSCSSCSYYHYRRQVVEKHINETHKGTGQVMVVREEFSAPPPGVTQPTIPAPTMDLKPWQCGLCKFKSMLRQEVAEHCAKIHSSKMQFKCPNCPFRTSTIENVTKHHANSHPTSKEDVIYYYYREGSIADEYDGTQRWMKQRQKMGIVDPEVKTEVDAPNTPVTPLVASTSIAVDLNLVKQETDDSEAVESIEDLCKRFGQFCEPNGLKFKCPLCKAIVEDTREAMQSHLFEELKYRKWSCSICSYKAFHKTGLKEHMFIEHRQNREPRQLPVNSRIETWVSELLNHQSALIEKTKENFALQRIQTEKPRQISVPVEIKKPEVVPEPKVEELQEAFGPLGASEDTDFCCPKCDFRVKEEVEMRNHLETELNRIRWRCSNCADKFQEYHEAQLHCKSVHPGQSSRPVEALRDPGKRAAWVAAVLRTQKLTMPIEKPQNAEPLVEESNIPSALDNSLLVVHYERNVPTPEEEMLVKRKKPAPTATTPDSDEERLVIDESTDDTTAKQKSETKSCPHCDFSSKYTSAVRDHVLRHYNLKPYTCGYCDYCCYVYQCCRHNETEHPDLPNKFSRTKIPNEPPLNLVLTKRGKRTPSRVDEDHKPKDDVQKKDDGPKVVCLVCQRTVSETETQTHVHEKVTAQFAKKGDVVVKCCNCLALVENIHSMQRHHNESHPNAHINYAFHKLQSETRDIHCCGHCSKGFKFLRDLRSHHNAVHRSLQLKYTLNSFVPTSNDIIDCDDEASTSKRKLEDTNPSPALKRVARKSTTKLPSQRIAKKSTTKLPYNIDADSESEREYSYYGTKPTSLDEYATVTALMPFCKAMIPFSVKKLSELIKINPKVIVKDFKK